MRKPASLLGIGALIFALLIGGATPASAAPVGPYSVTLHLTWIACYSENDEFGWWGGSDEPYITINGSRVWSTGNFDRNDVDGVEVWFGFDDSVRVEMWEDDGGLSGQDDHMGTFFMYASELGTGRHTVETPAILGPGKWWLNYEVV